MPYDIKAMGKRKDIIDWLEINVGKFGPDTNYWTAKGVGWELLPIGGNFNSIFEDSNKFIIRVWDKDLAFLTRLRWE
jgi:hypothetical protein